MLNQIKLLHMFVLYVPLMQELFLLELIKLEPQHFMQLVSYRWPIINISGMPDMLMYHRPAMTLPLLFYF